MVLRLAPRTCEGGGFAKGKDGGRKTAKNQLPQSFCFAKIQPPLQSGGQWRGAILPAGVIPSQCAHWRGNLNVQPLTHPKPIGHDGTQYLEIATVAIAPSQ